MRSILVVGAGGIGSYLIPLLQKHMSPGDQIIVMDGDKFENKNLDRQLFPRRLVGSNKATAMALMYPSGGHFASVTAVPHYLESPAQLLDTTRETALCTEALETLVAVVACPDNHQARMRCLQIADELTIPAVICGNELESSSAMLYFPVNKDTRADPRVVYPEMRKGSPRDPTAACTGAFQDENKQLAVANCMAAGMAVGLLYKAVLEPVAPSALKLLPFEMSWTVWGNDVTKSIKEMLEEPV